MASRAGRGVNGNSHDLHPHCFFFLFLKPEEARGNPASSHRPILGSELGEKKEKQHEISGTGASGPPGARGHEEPPTGYVGRCSVPQLLLLVPPARFSVGNMHRTYVRCSACASDNTQLLFQILHGGLLPLSLCTSSSFSCRSRNSKPPRRSW